MEKQISPPLPEEQRTAKTRFKNLLNQNAIWAAFLLSLVGTVGYAYFLFHAAKKLDDILGAPANYGDVVAGFVGTIFALSGIFAFYAALVEQQKALKTQQDELKETREMFERQKFENTFFNLLQNHIIMTNELVLRNPANNQEEARGRSCFRVIWKEKMARNIGKSDPVEALLENYTSKHFRETYFSEVAHYFNNFYRLMEYATTHDLVRNELPKKFVGLVIDQLSLFELNVILLHQKAGLFRDEMALWCEHYEVFDLLKRENESVVQALLKHKGRRPSPEAKRRKLKKPQTEIFGT